MRIVDEKGEERDMTPAEKAFLAEMERVKPLFKAKLDEADAALEAAKTIAQETGIPFRSYIVDNTSDSYVPPSFSKKFPEIDEEFLSEVAGIYVEEYGLDNGWQKSYC